MSGSDRDLGADQVRDRLAGADGARPADDHRRDEDVVDRAVNDVKRGIDHVADKVKGLLRSDR